MKDIFHKISSKVSSVAGSAGAFLGAVLVVVIWATTGPLFSFSNTWQLVINTGTTIITFLMVFLIQNTQNRDSKAMQLKLDELIRTSKGRDSFVDLEDLTDEELAAIDEEFKKMHREQNPAPALHKLHHKITAEHSRRKSLKDQAENAVRSLLNSQ